MSHLNSSSSELQLYYAVEIVYIMRRLATGHRWPTRQLMSSRFASSLAAAATTITSNVVTIIATATITSNIVTIVVVTATITSNVVTIAAPATITSNVVTIAAPATTTSNVVSIAPAATTSPSPTKEGTTSSNKIDISMMSSAELDTTEWDIMSHPFSKTFIEWGRMVGETIGGFIAVWFLKRVCEAGYKKVMSCLGLGM